MKVASVRATALVLLVAVGVACSGGSPKQSSSGAFSGPLPKCQELVDKPVKDDQWAGGCLADKNGKSTLEVRVSYECTDGTQLHGLGDEVWGRTGQRGEAGPLPDEAKQDCTTKGGVGFTPN